MKKIMKSATAVIAIMVLLLNSSLIISADDSENSGEAVIWVGEDDGLMTISGSYSINTNGYRGNVWRENNPKPYTNNDVIGSLPMKQVDFYGTGTNTVTFSEPVTNPVMLLVSIGTIRHEVTIDFDAPFTILSEGVGCIGYAGSYTLGDGDRFLGKEVNVAIQFNGTFNSISWNMENPESVNTFQIGIPTKFNGSEPTQEEDVNAIPDLYAVRVESNPSGVATFSGYGTGFGNGEAYNVNIASSDPLYEFTGWVGSPNGVIEGQDVALVANFELVAEEFEDEITPEAIEKKYKVSANSIPEDVATFTGEGLFRSGDSFKVAVDTVVEGYEFIRWETVNEGVIDGEDIEIIAVFDKVMKDDLIKEEPSEDIKEEPSEEVEEEPIEVLDEEIPEQVDSLPDTAGIPVTVFAMIGVLLSGSGLVIRKKTS